jgi:hypothetical protein
MIIDFKYSMVITEIHSLGSGTCPKKSDNSKYCPYHLRFWIVDPLSAAMQASPDAIVT